MQGQRPLTLLACKGFDQELLIPSAAATFLYDAVLTRMLLEQR